MTSSSIQQASYSLRPHLASIAPDPDAWASSRWLVLIDAGQQAGLAKRVLRQVPPERSAWLYKDTFAENALQLSPLLLELSTSHALAFDEIKRLDSLCAKWPIMSLIQTQQTAGQWLAHLRALLRLQMDGTPYLWRLADTQMLHAAVSVLNTEQRAMLLSPCQSWWMATDEGLAQNLVIGRVNADATWTTEPVQLDGEQATALLTASAVPTLSGQLRALAPDFAAHLSHFEQSRFARACIEEARENCLDEDAELLDWALERWRQTSTDVITQAAPLLQAQS
jgi:hypothetical protein